MNFPHPKSKSQRQIAAHWLSTPLGLIPWGVITVDKEGFITDIDSDPRIDSRSGVEFYSGILCPGLVNAHTHLELSYLKGKIPPGGGFAAFAEGLRKARSGADRDEKIASAAYWDAVMYNEGISAVGDISNSAETVLVKLKSGIDYHTFVEIYGLQLTDSASVMPVLNEFRKDGLTASVTPHSTYSLSVQGFKSAVNHDPDSLLSIHFMETEGEAALFQGEGDMRKWYDREGMNCDFAYIYDSPADRIQREIRPGRKFLLVHNTVVDEKTLMSLMSRYGDDITFVLCPESNEYISGGTPPVDLLRRLGCRIAIGTDSLASSNSLSIATQLKYFKHVPIEESLRWVTINGAEALGMTEKLGSIQIGKRPGITLVTGIDWQTMTPTDSIKSRRLV